MIFRDCWIVVHLQKSSFILIEISSDSKAKQATHFSHSILVLTKPARKVSFHGRTLLLNFQMGVFRINVLFHETTWNLSQKGLHNIYSFFDTAARNFLLSDGGSFNTDFCYWGVETPVVHQFPVSETSY